MKMKKALSIFAIALLLVGCGKKEVKLIPTENFTKEVDGKQVSLYTLHNGFLTMQVTLMAPRSSLIVKFVTSQTSDGPQYWIGPG